MGENLNSSAQHHIAKIQANNYYEATEYFVYFILLINDSAAKSCTSATPSTLAASC